MADGPWTPHVTGTVAPDRGSPDWDLKEWPPTGAEPLPLDGAYVRLAAAGYDYGPERLGATTDDLTAATADELFDILDSELSH